MPGDEESPKRSAAAIGSPFGADLRSHIVETLDRLLRQDLSVLHDAVSRLARTLCNKLATLLALKPVTATLERRRP
jgi:hypothetical protein